MSIWLYKEEVETPSLEDIIQEKCRFCNGILSRIEIDDRWAGISNKVYDLHRNTILYMAEIHGDFILEDMELIEEPEERAVYLHTCSLCGWWYVSKEIYLRTKNQFWLATFGAVASLKKLDLVDIRLPLDEVRQYLFYNPKCRYNIHPRLFEEVVASVFSNYGFKAEVTAYSADGGIDVILHNNMNQIVVVQVKRSKNSIKISSIREFLGAMLVNGYTSGIFLTTSRFQAGVNETVHAASSKGLEITLIDGEKFLKALQIAQLIDSKRYPRLIEDSIISSLNLQFVDEYHLNSL